jgi:hypothetical protein
MVNAHRYYHDFYHVLERARAERERTQWIPIHAYLSESVCGGIPDLADPIFAFLDIPTHFRTSKTSPSSTHPTSSNQTHRTSPDNPANIDDETGSTLRQPCRLANIKESSVGDVVAARGVNEGTWARNRCEVSILFLNRAFSLVGYWILPDKIAEGSRFTLSRSGLAHCSASTITELNRIGLLECNLSDRVVYLGFFANPVPRSEALSSFEDLLSRTASADLIEFLAEDSTFPKGFQLTNNLQIGYIPRMPRQFIYEIAQIQSSGNTLWLSHVP